MADDQRLVLSVEHGTMGHSAPVDAYAGPSVTLVADDADLTAEVHGVLASRPHGIPVIERIDRLLAW